MSGIQLISRSLYARPPPDASAGACSGMLCDLVSPLLYLLWIGVTAVVALTMVQYVRRARTECDEERGRLVAEREAFRQFGQRVSELSPDPDVAKTDGGVTPVAGSAAKDGAIEEIRTAYRETVMSVPHYESDYDESLTDHMRSEFGDAVASAVADGAFTPQLKAALVRRSTDAYQRRSSVIEEVDEEDDSLESAATDLGTAADRLRSLDETPLTEKDFDDLAATHEELEAIEADCREILTNRRDEVTGRDRSEAGDAPHDFHDYLYGPMAVSYPVLADATDLIERVRTARRRVVTALTRRA